MKSEILTKKTIQTLIRQGKIILLGIIILITVNAPLTHLFYPNRTKLMTEINYEKSNLVKSINNRAKLLFLDFESGKISKEEFVLQYNTNKEKFKIEKKVFKDKRKRYMSSISYRGFNTKHQFLFSFGLALFILITQIRFMNKVIKSSSELFEKIEVFLYTVMSSLIFTWSIRNFQDFKNSTYFIIFIILNLLVTVFIYQFLKHYSTLEIKLRGMVHTFSRLAIKDASKFMKSKEKELWKEHYLNEMEKGIDK